MKDIMNEFFHRRFGENQPHDSYYYEWVDRFNTGHPENYMDFESLRIYADVLEAKANEIQAGLLGLEELFK